MNRVLADTLTFLNTLLAILIVLIGGFIGRLVTDDAAGFLFGAVLGLLCSALMCGVIALLSLIEGHLAVIAASTATRSVSSRQIPVDELARQEPYL